MPMDWELNCYGCSATAGNYRTGPQVVVLWTYGWSIHTVGLCAKCLDLWLSNADDGTTDEPSRLDFLVDPAELMAVAT